MTTGFQSFMTNGVTILVDTTNLCYVFKGKYAVGGGTTNFTIANATDYSVLAFGGDGYSAVACKVNANTWTVLAQGYTEVYHFDMATTLSPHGVGMQLLREDGGIAYDSGQEIMPVVAAFQAPNYDQRGLTEWGYGLPTGRYAIAPAGGCTARQASAQGQIFTTLMDTYRCTANAAFVKLAPVAQYNAGSPTGISGIRGGTSTGPIVTVIDISRLG